MFENEALGKSVAHKTKPWMEIWISHEESAIHDQVQIPAPMSGRT